MDVCTLKKSKLSLLAATILFASCATSQKAPKEAKKPAKPSAAQVDANKPSAAQLQLQQKDKLNDDMQAFVARLTVPENAFTVQDRQFTASLAPSPKGATLHEAALVVGLLRDVMTPPGGMPKTADLDQVAKPSTTPDDTAVIPKTPRTLDEASIIEKRTREKGVDLVKALSTNPALKNAAVYSWAWNASMFDGNSDIFKQGIEQTVKSEASLWVEIAQKSGATMPALAAAVPGGSPAAQPTSPASSASPSGSVPLVAATPAGVDSNGATLPGDGGAVSGDQKPSMSQEESAKILSQAQDFASKENYAKAVETVSKIPEGAPNYEIARENNRQWSNRAVTDLRKKAAFDYRSATSVSDSTAKKNFLTKAKSSLDEAIAKYPASSMIETVKDNLKVIEGELERIPNH